MTKDQKNAESRTAENVINDFIGKYRKVLLAAGIIILVAVVAVCAAVGIIQSRNENMFNSLLDLENRYNSILAMDDTSAEYAAERDSFISDAEALSAEAGLKKYQGAKAELMIADLLFDEGDYQSAADRYNAVASAQSGTYLGPLALMNAAAAYDEMGSTDEALSLYNVVFDTYGSDNAFAPKALFNAARIYEAQGNIELAKATFEQLTGLYASSPSGESEYAKMAEAHLIALN